MLVPPAPGVLCADGLLAADLKAEFSRTLPKAGTVDVDAAEAIFAELEERAGEWLTTEGVAPEARALGRVVLMRYHGQGGEVTVPWAGSAAATEAAFAAAHETLYGFVLDSPIELVTLRVEAIGHMPPPPRPSLPAGSGAAHIGTQTVHFASGSLDVPLIDRARLGAGDRFSGPAIITQLDATTLVAPGWQGEVHPSGAILLTRAGDDARSTTRG